MSYANPEAYDRFMGRWSDRLAPPFLGFAGAGGGARVLDVGCGTGSLVRALLASGAAVRVTGIDPVADFVRYARRAVPGRRATFLVGATEALPFADGAFDAALALLALQDFSDTARAVREMARVTRRGGRVGACQWDFAAGLPLLSLFWRAAETIAPEAVARRRREAAATPAPVAGLDELAMLWRACGLARVETARLELTMEFACFEDYWRPFLGGATPTSAFARELDRTSGGAVAGALSACIPDVRAGGSFVLGARAWAVAGMVER